MRGELALKTIKIFLEKNLRLKGSLNLMLRGTLGVKYLRKTMIRRERLTINVLAATHYVVLIVDATLQLVVQGVISFISRNHVLIL